MSDGQFAYNEMSFFLIKLLQRFAAMELAPEAAPPGALPPKEWAGAPGRKGKEQFWPKTHLTLYSNVRRPCCAAMGWIGVLTDWMQGGMWVRMTEAEENEVVVQA